MEKDTQKKNTKTTTSIKGLEKFLPLGTVVLLQKGTKKLMITGFVPITKNEDKELMFDYVGCLYPEGIISADDALLFNHEDIHKVFYLGYSDEEEEEFKALLDKEFKDKKDS